MSRADLPRTPESIALSATRRRIAFARQLSIYAVVCTGLVAIWALTPSRVFWPGFVIAGWGVALLIQAAGRRLFSPGSAAWERIHAEELDRARRTSAR